MAANANMTPSPANGAEGVVLGALDALNEQGAIPAFIERFIGKGEIDPTRFEATGIVEAMCKFLLDRGIVISDSADDIDRFDRGEFDEHFADAYNFAILRSLGEDDPLDAARNAATAKAYTGWDFNVRTFDDVQQQGIIAENIRAAGAIDYIYELGDRMGIFRLADALVLNWSSGAIDVAGGETAGKLFRYWKERENRSSDEERGMLNARVLNKGGAKVLSRMVVNESFPNLWHRLMEEIAEYIDKAEKIRDGRSITSPVSSTPIYNALRELQYNLTEYCTGMAHMQAHETYRQLEEAFDILGDPEVIAHFGSTRRKSMWTVIERLSKQEFGLSVPIGPLLRLAVDGNRVFQICAGFDEGTFQPQDLDELLAAGEAYILNSSLVDERAGFESAAEDEDFDEDIEDEFEDELGDEDFDDF